MNHPSRLVALISFVLGVTTSYAATDLRLTSIVRNGECTTLEWVSHPNEFYTVYWTDSLNPPVFWHVAEVNVPSGGTNTTWSEGSCGEMMMSGSSSSGGTNSLSETEIADMIEAARERAEEGIKFLMEKLEEALSGGESALFGSPAPGTNGGGGTNHTSDVVALRFYRVARTAVAGFVDGWGPGLGTVPSDLTNAFAISASPRYAGTHSLAVRADGTVAAWGANGFGQCNVPTNLADVVAVAAGGMHSVALTRNGSVVSWGNTSLGQVTNAPANLTNVVDVKAGIWHTLALRADGTVTVWGDLFNRSNAVPAGLTNVTAIAAGPRHCLALRCDGQVVAWGFTYSNILGNFLPTNVPSTLSNVVAVSAGMEHNQALRSDGTIMIWGNTNNNGFTHAPALLTNMIGVSAGWHYGTALSNDLTIVEWGDGSTQAGFDTIAGISVGAMHTLVIHNNTKVPIIRVPPRNLLVPTNTPATNFVVATSSTNITYQWKKNGVNISGATNSTLIFSSVQDSDEADYLVEVSTSARTNLGGPAHLTTMHAPVLNSQSPTEFDLHLLQGTLTNFSVDVYSKGVTPMYRWEKDGAALPAFTASYAPNLSGLVGEGSYRVVASNKLGAVTSAVWRVQMTLLGESHLWGDTSVDQTNGFRRHETNLIAISAGGYHTLGLREDRTVVAWGYNNAGQTNVPAGLTNVVAIAGGGSHSMALLENGIVRAWGNNASGQTNVPAGLSNVTAIAAGGPQSLALRRDGSLVAWGLTPVPTNITNVASMSAGPNHVLAVLSNGTVQAWHTPSWIDLTPPAGLSNVVATAVGSLHALALKRDGTVVSWGDNTYGQTNVPAGLSNVLKIAAGGAFSLALKNDGTVVGWGDNNDGQTNAPTGLGDVYAISAGSSHSVALTYEPSLDYPVNVATDLLLIYHTNSSNSIFLKNYYRTNRPLVWEAMELGVGGEIGEVSADSTRLTNELLNVVSDWYAANPTIRPRYILCFLDVPTRYFYGTHSGQAGGVSALIRDAAGHRPPFVNYIAMGAPLSVPAETNMLIDCLGYTDKVARFGSNYSPGKLAISASTSTNLYHNDNYLLDDKAFSPGYQSYKRMLGFYQGLLAAGVSSNVLDYVPVDATNDYRYGTNVAAYMSWGSYGWQLGYAYNPQVYFHGDSSWYIMATIESFNGDRSTGGMGNYTEWFWSHAFGGSNYSATPVGAVCHTDEPGVVGTQNAAKYFGLWARGKNFATAAWLSRGSEGDSALGPEGSWRILLVVGDPFVKNNRISNEFMKTNTLIFIVCFGFARLGLGQGFINLNFEACTLSTNIVAFVNTSEAFPGWSVYRGGILQSQVPYNAGIAQESFVSMNATARSIPALFGNYNARLIASPSDSIDVALAQTGQIPSGMSSLQFVTSSSTIPGDGLVVSFDNTPLSLQPVGFFPGYTLWGADISAFAGLTGELRFTANHSGGPWLSYLDDIAFVPVPEPSTWALLALGGAAFAGMARRRK